MGNKNKKLDVIKETGPMDVDEVKYPDEDLVNVVSQKEALAVLIKMLEVAQSRGAFNFQESSKILEAIKVFVSQK